MHWCLDDNQVKSAFKLLDRLEGKTVETIPVTQRDGTATLAFAFTEILDSISSEVEEVLMDSTCE